MFVGSGEKGVFVEFFEWEVIGVVVVFEVLVFIFLVVNVIDGVDLDLFLLIF